MRRLKQLALNRVHEIFHLIARQERVIHIAIMVLRKRFHSLNKFDKAYKARIVHLLTELRRSNQRVTGPALTWMYKYRFLS